jgi:ankyrin repeat protein
MIRDKPNTVDVVRRLVERGAPINEIKYENDGKIFFKRRILGLGTPLHRAAENGKTDVVKYRLE